MTSIPSPALPPLRRELVIRRDETTAEGEPTWTIQDPVAGKYHTISWATKEIIDRWLLAHPQMIAESVRQETPLLIDEEDVKGVAQSLFGAGLLDLRGADNSAALAAQAAALKPGFWTWLLHNYLFIRIPVFNPDRLLAWLAPRTSFLYARGFFLLSALAAVFGLVLVGRQWEHFKTTFVDHLTADGALLFGAVLFLTKVCHEFGHALTAKRNGAKVPSMGVALVVMFPMLYTDTNDTWRFGSSRRRLQVSVAGVATELLLACWATLAWGLLPDCGLRSACFIVATATWLTTLLLNMSPFMRFDGYFVLSDWAGIPNLHEEAGALGKWKLRQVLFGFDDPMPEVTSPSKAPWLIAFAWFTWVYRFTVFLGIAALVYHFSIKIVGIALFIVEIGYFILLPIFMEVREWSRRAESIRTSARAVRLGMAVLTVLVLCCLPWPGLVHVSAVLRTAEDRYLYAPEAAELRQLLVADGALVKAGQPLAVLDSARIVQRQQETAARVRRVTAQLASARVSEELSERLPVALGELETARSQSDAAADAAARLRPVAPCDGVLKWLDPELAQGAWVAKDEPLFVVRHPAEWEVVAYVDDETIHRVFVGASANFYVPDHSARAIPLSVVRIDRDVAQVLTLPILAETAGGSVPAHADARGNAIPTRSVYRVTLVAREPLEDFAGHDWRGRLVIRGAGEAPFTRLYRSALSLLWREAGF
jgi:putative peptide zinc metalloprotease protein